MTCGYCSLVFVTQDGFFQIIEVARDLRELIGVQRSRFGKAVDIYSFGECLATIDDPSKITFIDGLHNLQDLRFLDLGCFEKLESIDRWPVVDKTIRNLKMLFCARSFLPKGLSVVSTGWDERDNACARARQLRAYVGSHCDERLKRWANAHYVIFNVTLAFFPLNLSPYEVLFIVDQISDAMLVHSMLRKCRLIESVQTSCRHRLRMRRKQHDDDEVWWEF